MLIGQPGEKPLFARTRRRRVDDTKIDLEWTVCVCVCEDVDWIIPTQDRVQRWTALNNVIKIRIP